jgi:hypothetical protein
VNNLFIDTSIFLSFYLLSSDDLEELRKLSALIRTNKIKLILPQQVIDEFHRNRDNQIANGLKILKEEKLNNQFPQFCKEYEEYKEMKAAIKKYEENKKALFQKLQSDIEQEELKADKIIDELFSLGTVVEITVKIYNDSIKRYNRGNPPGKDKSYGDAINWMCLIHEVDIGEDIDIISDDGDYVSSVGQNQLKPFLEKEWHNEKGGEAILYKNLSEYFSQNFKEIKLADEYEKELLIKDLVESSNFRTTHQTIWELRKFSNFSKGQAEAIISAAITNNQIKWIRDDSDVSDFLFSVAETSTEILDEHLLVQFYDIYHGNDE